jgi:mono/diheme cytochrome c family protein
MIMKLNLLIIVVLLFSAQQGISQEWLVPAEKQSVKNPSEFNLENVKRGKEIFMRECKSCHGEPGKNNGLALVPPPPDVTAAIMQDNTDGALFYKISTGKGVMPAFEATLSEGDRWLLVNFIKNYNPAITPLLVDAPPVKASLTASVDAAKRVVTVLAGFQNKKGANEALTETPVTISVERAFGNLPVGQVLTDNKGGATFTMPENIIGDEEGYLTIVVSLGEGFEAEKVTLEKTKIGIPKETPKLIKKGVIWSTNENISMWMLLSYLAAIGGAWLTIGYVVFQIFKIGRLSKE